LQHSFVKSCEILSKTIDVPRASVWELTDDGAELHCLNLYEANKNAHSHGAVLNAQDMPKYFDAIMADSRIFAEDVQNDPRTDELTENYLKPLRITSMLDAGIVIDGKLVGVVCAVHGG
jgi:GAF domain-containing protein